MQNKGNKKDSEKQKRLDNYEMQREQMLELGYKESVGTISIIKANIMAFVTAGPFVILAIILYLIIWDEISFNFNLLSSYIFLVSMIISIPLHEFIHGFTWHLFCKHKWKSIHFGVMWEFLTPYCHCKEPLNFRHYIIGGLMPLIVLGFGISSLGIALNRPILLAIGAINILSAGGDTTIAFMLLKYRKSEILDHPTDCGFVAFSKENM